MTAEPAITIGATAAISAAAAASSLPTAVQCAAALAGALVGLWGSAVDTWGTELCYKWGARLLGRVLLAAMIGVLGSTALHVSGPSAWSYLHSAHPGTWYEDLGAAVLGLAMWPAWLTSPLISAGSLWALPLIGSRLSRLIAGSAANAA